VIDHRQIVEDIISDFRKLIGLEMEAYGAHRACEDTLSSPTPFLCAKSICDFASNKNDRWQNYAAHTSAQFCYRFLLAEWENLALGPQASTPRPPLHDDSRSVPSGPRDGYNTDPFIEILRHEFPGHIYSELVAAAVRCKTIDAFVTTIAGPGAAHDQFIALHRGQYRKFRERFSAGHQP
jgi:hypothetical protein